MASRSRNIQFVDVSQTHPTRQHAGGSRRESQKAAHSHAARVSHARRRQLETAEYQAKQNEALLPQSGKNHRTSAEEERVYLAIPSPTSFLSSARTDPFRSFAHPLSTEENFLLDHYMTAVLPSLIPLKVTSKRCSANYRSVLVSRWVPLALSSPCVGTLRGLLLAACRHLALYRRDYYSQRAVQYKVCCIRGVNEALSAGSLDNWTVATAMSLAYDEAAVGDYVTAAKHLNGAIQMLKMVDDGKGVFGLDGVLEHMIHAFVYDKELLELQRRDQGPACPETFLASHTTYVQMALNDQNCLVNLGAKLRGMA